MAPGMRWASRWARAARRTPAPAAVLTPAHQLVDRQPGMTRSLRTSTPAAQRAHDDGQRQQRGQQAQAHGAIVRQQVQHVVDHAMEQAAQQQRRAGPDHRADRSYSRKRRKPVPVRPAMTVDSAPAPGRNLHTSSARADAQVQPLRLADAGILRQRQLADHAKQARTVAPARQVPEAVGQQAGQRGRDPRRQPAGRAGQRAGGDQHGIGGHGQAGLFDQDVPEHQPGAVLLQQQLYVLHRVFRRAARRARVQDWPSREGGPGPAQRAAPDARARAGFRRPGRPCQPGPVEHCIARRARI